jgi:malonate transporter
MESFQGIVALTGPLFLLVLLGYALGAWLGWPKAIADALTRFVFAAAIPAMLFQTMSKFSQMPRADARLLIAFFGGCLIVFVVGRLLSRFVFRLDGESQSVFSMGGIFSNIVLLGLPIAKVTMGDTAIPPVSMVVVFNAFILWTLVTVSVEWARHGAVSWAGIGRTARGVFTNPIVVGILSGTAFGFTGLELPGVLDRTLTLVGQSAVPLSLIALGMGLAQYGVRDGWRESLAIVALKLALMPVVVFGLARLLGLPPLETRAVVMLAAMPVGANVYLMAEQFKVMGGPIAASLVLSTLIASISVPLVLALLAP